MRSHQGDVRGHVEVSRWRAPSAFHRYRKSIRLLNVTSAQRTVFRYESYAAKQAEINDKLL